MAYYSRNTTGGETPGSTIVVPFDYLSDNHVSITVDGVAVVSSLWEWTSAGLITCLASFPLGAETITRRTTPIDEPVGELTGGAFFNFPDVNKNDLQNIFALQEYADGEAERQAVIDNFAVAAAGIEADKDDTEAARDVAVAASEDAIEAMNTVAGITRAVAMATVIPVVMVRFKTSGYYLDNDRGGAWYKRVASEPAHHLKFQDDDSVWFEIDETSIWLQMGGCKADNISPFDYDEADVFKTARALVNGGAGPTDNSDNLQLCIEACHTLDAELLVGGHFFVTKTSYLPQGDGHTSWSRDKGITIRSATNNRRFCSINTNGTEAILCQAGMDFFTDLDVGKIEGAIDPESFPDTQYFGHKVTDITLVGPMDFDTPCSGLVLANTRQPSIQGTYAFGFCQGDGVLLFSQHKGGMFGPVLERVAFGHDSWDTSNYRTLEAMKYGLNQNHLRVLNRAYSVGKTNDLEVRGFYGLPAIESQIKTKPVDLGGAGDNYGPGDIRVFGGFGHAEPVRKFREGTITQTTSTTWVIAFNDTPPVADLNPDGNLHFVLVAEADGRTQYRKLSAWDEGTKTMTITSAFSTADPVDGSEARIMLSTDTARNDNPSYTVLARGADIHSNENVSFSGLNFEETECPLAISDNVKRLTLVAPRLKVSDSIKFKSAETGGDSYVPISLLGGGDWHDTGYASGYNLAVGNTHKSNDADVRSRAGTGATVSARFYSSASGIKVKHGSCVRLSSTLDPDTGLATYKDTTANNLDWPVAVHNITANKEFESGDYIQFTESGFAYARIAATTVVSVGDRLGSAAGGLWRVTVPTDAERDAPLIAHSEHDGTGPDEIIITAKMIA